MDSNSLVEWFFDFATLLQQAGARIAVTSGMACVYYNLAETTKDCDLWIQPTSLDIFRDVIGRVHWQGHSLRHRSRLSVPLDPRWLNGGWSAHLHWNGVPSAHLDIFGRLPRVIDYRPLDQVYSDEESLARVKMTQRDRDWPTVHLLGDRLLLKGMPRALLFLQKAEDLWRARTIISPDDWVQMGQIRPLLNQLDEQIAWSTYDAFLRIERTFWQRLDHLRLDCFQNAGKEYARSTGQVLRQSLELDEQNDELTKIALELLPMNPLENKAIELVGRAQEEALEVVDRNLFKPEFLPLDWASQTIEASSAR